MAQQTRMAILPRLLCMPGGIVKLFRCCCDWSFVISRKKVYGPIYQMGIGDFPTALSNTQRMMSRAAFEDEYADCAACHAGMHKHLIARYPLSARAGT
jgi:hypothetical protein